MATEQRLGDEHQEREDRAEAEQLCLYHAAMAYAKAVREQPEQEIDKAARELSDAAERHAAWLRRPRFGEGHSLSDKCATCVRVSAAYERARFGQEGPSSPRRSEP